MHFGGVSARRMPRQRMQVTREGDKRTSELRPLRLETSRCDVRSAGGKHVHSTTATHSTEEARPPAGGHHQRSEEKVSTATNNIEGIYCRECGVSLRIGYSYKGYCVECAEQVIAKEVDDAFMEKLDQMTREEGQ
jgi:hypothetical protein